MSIKNNENHNNVLLIGIGLIGGAVITYWLMKDKLDKQKQESENQLVEQKQELTQELEQKLTQKTEEFKQEKRLFKQKSNEQEEEFKLLVERVKRKELI